MQKVVAFVCVNAGWLGGLYGWSEDHAPVTKVTSLAMEIVV